MTSLADGDLYVATVPNLLRSQENILSSATVAATKEGEYVMVGSTFIERGAGCIALSVSLDWKLRIVREGNKSLVAAVNEYMMLVRSLKEKVDEEKLN